VRRSDGSEAELQIQRPVRSVPSPVTAYLQKRGDRTVNSQPEALSTLQQQHSEATLH
jgi:hypothetical protein